MTGGLITILSVVVIGVVPNKGSVLAVANGAVDVIAGGSEKVLSLVIVGAVTTDADSFGIVD